MRAATEKVGTEGAATAGNQGRVGKGDAIPPLWPASRGSLESMLIAQCTLQSCALNDETQYVCVWISYLYRM